MPQSCIFCQYNGATHLHSDDTRHEYKRDYFHCAECNVIFVPPDQRLSPQQEFQRYELHENSPVDPEYRAFLSRLFEPVNSRLKPASRGLDFGSGPGPTLSVMFEEAGHDMALYDVFYANRPKVFRDQYDFITTSETAEHLFHPLEEFERLWNCLKPGGILGIMTQLYPDNNTFKDWHYKNDDTHVVFYSHKSFRWLGKRWEAEPEFIGNDVILFLKPL